MKWSVYFYFGLKIVIKKILINLASVQAKALKLLPVKFALIISEVDMN